MASVHARDLCVVPHHALNAVVLEQIYVRAHLGNRAHFDHHHIVDLGKLLLVEAAGLGHAADIVSCTGALYA